MGDELTPDKRLLEYLKDFGIGNYQNITGILRQIFPLQYFTDYSEYADNQEHFLNELQKNGYIHYKILRPNRAIMVITGAITREGMEYISPKEEPKQDSQFHVHFGDHAQVGQLASSLSSSNTDIKFTTPQTNKKQESKIKRILKIILIIISILGGLFGIYKGVYDITKASSPNTMQDTSEPNLQVTDFVLETFKPNSPVYISYYIRNISDQPVQEVESEVAIQFIGAKDYENFVENPFQYIRGTKAYQESQYLNKETPSKQTFSMPDSLRIPGDFYNALLNRQEYMFFCGTIKYVNVLNKKERAYQFVVRFDLSDTKDSPFALKQYKIIYGNNYYIK